MTNKEMDEIKSENLTQLAQALMKKNQKQPDLSTVEDVFMDKYGRKMLDPVFGRFSWCSLAQLTTFTAFESYMESREHVSEKTRSNARMRLKTYLTGGTHKSMGDIFYRLRAIQLVSIVTHEYLVVAPKIRLDNESKKEINQLKCAKEKTSTNFWTRVVSENLRKSLLKDFVKIGQRIGRKSGNDDIRRILESFANGDFLTVYADIKGFEPSKFSQVYERWGSDSVCWNDDEDILLGIAQMKFSYLDDLKAIKHIWEDRVKHILADESVSSQRRLKPDMRRMAIETMFELCLRGCITAAS